LLEIVEKLDEWYTHTNDGDGPNGGALLFDDDKTFREHVKAVIVKARANRRP